VDALRNVHRMLVPGGVLLESHPLATGSRVEADGRVLGALDEREFARELVVMNRSLGTVVDEGLFTPRDERTYEVTMRFESAVDLLSEVVTWRGSTISTRLQRAVKRADPDAPLALRIDTALRVYARREAGSPLAA
jgi:hypothetical protein